jgi:sarcosine oxidase
MSQRYDAIVVGLGGMGSAAAWQLARRGLRVLGLEQFALGHDRGSSHGLSRIIRQAYYEHPDYVPLVRAAYGLWYDLEQRHGGHLLTNVPCLSIGPPEGELIVGVRQSALEHGLPIEVLDWTALRQRYPTFRIAEDQIGVLETTAGVLQVDECVRAMQEQARRLGAELRALERVESWQADSASVGVRTDSGTYRAGRLVLTAGPWAGGVLAGLGLPLTVMRQVVLWYGTTDDARFCRDRFPIFIADTPGGYFYGMPALDPHGVKVARHYGAAELPDPSGVAREVTAADEVPVRAFLASYLPEVMGPLRRSSVCLYTLTPDRHFLIDTHPEYRQVVFAAGFSGHGFKFAPVVGAILADLAQHGGTDWPIGLFGLRRFSPSPLVGEGAGG